MSKRAEVGGLAFFKYSKAEQKLYTRLGKIKKNNAIIKIKMGIKQKRHIIIRTCTKLKAGGSRARNCARTARRLSTIKSSSWVVSNFHT